jgi:hypothetical protein
MKLEFGDTKLVEKETSLPINGSFSLGKPLNWKKCREQFARDFDEKTDGFFFSHPNGSSDCIAAFVSKTEDIIEVVSPLPERTRFCRTNVPYALWITPSSFWKECFVRRSLFTILLRCGFEYRPLYDNYEDALKSNIYSQETLPAIRRFLFGYTQFTNNDTVLNGRGWRDLFVNKDVEEIRSKLTLPKNANIEKTMIGLGTIWN